MAVPSKKDYDNYEKILTRLSKGLTKEGRPTREMDENRAKELFRQAVRKRWMHCNQKLKFLESQRQPDMDNSTRRKWYYVCAKCGGHFKKDDVDVDHRKGEKSFTEWDQAFEYASSILDVGAVDLQLLCNDNTDTNCHSTKSTCERLGLDWTTEEGWNQALLEQELIKIMATKASGQRKFLLDNNVEPASNETLRKEQIRKILEGKYEESDG